MQQVADQYTAPAGPGQVVAYTGTAGTIAAALPESAQFVWVFVTSIAHVRVSRNALSQTALVTDFPLPANWPVKIPLTGNDGTYKVSAIQSAAGGNLHCCPVAY
mgnify:CR=1 FL=1